MSLLAWLPFYPLISFLCLIIFARRLSWLQASVLGIGGIALSAVASALVINQLINTDAAFISVKLWSWFSLGSSAVNFSFYLDALSAVMIAVVSGVGLLIHAYAAAYMKNDENFSRFMAYMNLFIVAMLILVLADNLVLLYLGWEGVGLCSFLLIGFWYREKENVLAARKAFIVTRVGDTAMAIGLFLLFKSLGELNIAAVNESAAALWQIGDELTYWIALLLLGGAVGKSAQLPLQTWLPDAMAGPTPVSALIHAATMVTAGVYLIARMQGIFLLSPEVMSYVAWVGALTLLLAGFAALAQTDIKRVLAYSTMSQIGYMMLALGAGAWSAGIFHLMTHAFFKALLFLTAGSVILALHHQQDLFKMGGLLKKLPVESGLFIVGLICLMALPGTSGFFSKEAIIAVLWSSPTAGPVLWWGAILGALLTSIYSCRLFFLGFLGKSRRYDKLHALDDEHPRVLLRWPLFLLALLSLLGGLIALDFTAVFAAPSAGTGVQEPGWLHPLAIATPFIGIAFSWFFFKDYRQNQGQELAMKPRALVRFCSGGLGFDRLYQALLVRPYCFLATVNRRDIIDQLIMLNGWYVRLWHDALSASQNGSLRWYAAGIGLAVVFLAGVITL
ncbi:NADH-quinone oxidoreductase subunit L [Thalassomonas viridans]|uniref:NADH-quinone oxidoreductase subunit L n=1 Tax=Thalassomonas viridans TaxID=137584 RepID=A0AAF0C842_9GAMM|nr:NADH-quinone oxidoreductase subunit L [Thalassomonas viridans]WDE03825.1 NADH-quinone oxidoreductase subunit L [Thalassomonas viridans]